MSEPKPKYKYKWREWSMDTRRFTIESDRKLSEEELDDIGRDGSFHAEVGDLHKKERHLWDSNEDGIYITFDGTDYGDDAQSDSWEVKA
tara:strand:- start:932 stop:1198 length:267 start_codon:yes stop_codon:yes gene_type:complete